MAFLRIRDWLNTITKFRNGDYIAVDGVDSAKMPANLLATKEQLDEATKEFKVIHNSEYAFAIVDSNDLFLFGIKLDGSVEWSKGIPSPIQESINAILSRIDSVDASVLILEQLCSHFKFISNNEYIYAVIDQNGTFLFGVRKDGSFDWSKGIPEWLESRIQNIEDELLKKVDSEEGKTLINAIFANGIDVVSNSEYVLAVLDNSGAFLFGIKKDGSFDWSKGLPKVIQERLYEIELELNVKQEKIDGKTLIDENFSNHVKSSNNREWFFVLLDLTGRIIESISPKGIHSFNLPVKFNGGVDWSKENIDQLSKELKDNGFTSGTGDWSDNTSLDIPVPEMAIINFSNISQMPQTKTTDAHAIMEFWDMNGNYFKKKVIANAQGSSSLARAKKNISIDICNDDWIGDDTFKIKFGEWVAQDSFHIKAYDTDFFRCVGLVGYDLVKSILDSRHPNTTWKDAINYGNNPVATNKVNPQIDSGALCYPQGFVCKVFLNGSFEGLFCWQLKKHRDNYNMDKKTSSNIHLDGMLNGSTFFAGNIDWTAFEVRNPKDLITYTGVKYDGDNPTELIDSTSSAYDASNSKHVMTAQVKQYIINLSNRMAEIGTSKVLFEKYFGLNGCIDYVILSDVLYNYDYVKNAQWTTWDGEKWFINPYDLDCTIGANSAGDNIHYPTTSHTTTNTNHPLKFVIDNYTSELEQRWEELRNENIIDARKISSNLEHYVRLFGKEGYKQEYEKWLDVSCNRNPVIDTDDWELEVDSNGNPVIYTSEYNTWNSSTTYGVGYKVQYNVTGSSVGNLGWWYRFTAKRENLNKRPITKTGFKDNIYRVYNWLALQINNMDNLYNYQGG